MTIPSTQRIFFISALCVCLLFIAPAVFAHGDEEHGESSPAETTVLSNEQMEQMITLLQQVVALLTQYKAQYGMYVSTPAYSAPVSPTPVLHEEMEEHEEHAEEAAATPALIIEIEPHYGRTHAHVRYTDKPEEMFFVDPAISDEDGVVAALAARTGLSAEVVRAALKYME